MQVLERDAPRKSAITKIKLFVLPASLAQKKGERLRARGPFPLSDAAAAAERAFSLKCRGRDLKL